ncbi:hypothetical protein HID58_073842 [Brassica napus]|uniref:BURP domain-containing protein n=1 Tax=Brassica napus TaxID=3708 RepID=A0ABQ7YI78_BRANA|nr:hypothetical protein HID58_073842 [Brassica napus]
MALVVEAHTSRKLISNKEQEDQNTSHLLKDGEFEDPSMSQIACLLQQKRTSNTSSTSDKKLISFLSLNSPQGKAMKKTLVRCNYKEIEGEYKFCGTSLESMLDLAKKTIASNADIKVMTTKVIAQNTTSYALHNYTLVTDDGRQRVVGPAVCHMNTSMWNADHVAFKVLKIEPRSAPVCHFFPLDNIVWLAN